MRGRIRRGVMGSADIERSMGIAHVAIGVDELVFAHFSDFEPPELYDQVADGDEVEFELGGSSRVIRVP